MARPMNAEDVTHAVLDTVAEVAKLPTAALDLSRSAGDHGIDSLALLVLRESLEKRLDVEISDDAWIRLKSLGDIVQYVNQHAAAGAPTPAPRGENRSATNWHGAFLAADGSFHDRVEVGMPMTGLNGLGESPLLKYLGHLRWSHLSALCGVASRDVKDAEGHRLYPTFFFVDLRFPRGRHMGTYAENDWLRVVCTMERFGGSMLDGLVYLLPADGSEIESSALNPESAIAQGIPVARLSNIFVKQFGGAEWLRKSRPAMPGFLSIPEATVPPDAYLLAKQAEERGWFETPSPDCFALTEGVQRVDYTLVPDRDLNGAGLVYFANYPVFLDICERQILKQGRRPLSDQQLDRRALVRRRSAYLNNASSRDTLAIELEAWLDDAAARESGQADQDVSLLVSYRMRRLSDGRLMMVSWAEKVLTGCSLRDITGGR